MVVGVRRRRFRGRAVRRSGDLGALEDAQWFGAFAWGFRDDEGFGPRVMDEGGVFGCLLKRARAGQ